MTMSARWREVHATEVPDGLRWDCPRENQGQIVVVEYGGPATEKSEHDWPFSEWKRVTDLSDRSVRYYRRAKGGA